MYWMVNSVNCWQRICSIIELLINATAQVIRLDIN